jgi:hypothetical protein
MNSVTALMTSPNAEGGNQAGFDTMNTIVYDQDTTEWVAVTRLDVANPATGDHSLRTAAISRHSARGGDEVTDGEGWSELVDVLDNGLENNNLQVYGARLRQKFTLEDVHLAYRFAL